MLNCIGRYYNISDVDLCFQRTCNTCIDHCIHLKQICQDLGTDTRIDLTDSAADDYHFFIAHLSCIKIHRRTTGRLHISQLSTKCLHFFLHCSDNTDFLYHYFNLLYLMFVLFFPPQHLSAALYFYDNIDLKFAKQEFCACFIYTFCVILITDLTFHISVYLVSIRNKYFQQAEIQRGFFSCFQLRSTLY